MTTGMAADQPTAAADGGTGAGDLIVDVQGASRSFRVGSEDIWAVRDASLQIRRGEFVVLIGRSGSGKTTLLNLVAGLDRPTSGTVRVDGDEITRYTERQLTQMRRRKVGFVFQSFGLLPLLSAYENVELALRIAGTGIRQRRRRTEELLEAVGLAGRARHRPYELSGGEQQRVAIARALANEPALILADEPTGELDSSTAVSIFTLLHDLVQDRGVTILTTTHDRTVMELVPRVEEMRDGRLLEPEEQELFRYTVREARSRFAAELPADVQEEVAATAAHRVDFAPDAAERMAAMAAAHPESSEEATRSAVGGEQAPMPAPVAEPEGEARTFAPPPEVERPEWRARDEEAAEEEQPEEAARAEAGEEPVDQDVQDEPAGTATESDEPFDGAVRPEDGVAGDSEAAPEPAEQVAAVDAEPEAGPPVAESDEALMEDADAESEEAPEADAVEEDGASALMDGGAEPAALAAAADGGRAGAAEEEPESQEEGGEEEEVVEEAAAADLPADSPEAAESEQGPLMPPAPVLAADEDEPRDETEDAEDPVMPPAPERGEDSDEPEELPDWDWGKLPDAEAVAEEPPAPVIEERSQWARPQKTDL